MKEKDFKNIIHKFQKGSADQEDLAQLNSFENYFLEKNNQGSFKSEMHKMEVQRNIYSRVKKKVNRNFNWGYRIAAGISLLIGVGGSCWLAFKTEPTLKYLSITTSDNQIKTIVLKDSSLVTLNQNSVLEFPEHFTDTSRTVRLQGEAYFKVTKDFQRPFRVYADSVVTEVLGTEFNIKMQARGMSVALVSGGVEVKGFGTSHTLTKHQKVDFDYKSRSVALKEFSPDRELFWIHKTLVFENTPLDSIATILEEHFQVSISIETQELKYKKITGNFKGKSLSAILLTMSKTLDFEFKGTSEKNIKIYKPQ